MTYNKWFMYFAIYALVTVVMQIGEASSDFIVAADVNDAVGFQVDKEASGAGFLGLLRNVVDFFTELLPKLIFFNYSFLQGDLQLIQWLLILIFGGTLIAMTVGQRILGGGR